MPELLPTRAMARARRMMLSAVSVLPLLALPGVGSAQSVPAGLRACAADSDAGRRLDCYDREMARLLSAPAAAKAAPPAAEPKPAEPATAPSTAAVQDAVQPAPASPASKPAAQAAPAPRHSMWRIFTGGASSPVTARVASLERWPDAMILHLDNGQVWQQTGRASGDLSLQVGDEVTIEKHLGSYWLSSRHVSNMKVRQKQH
ncbi:MAG TPA: hypothetical protein VHE11_04625 [Steroidobacteraceae bacterium]|nr:hypothetical protein [Steroidobacteraceae bacterium]